jgi:hypothetical protein
MRSQGELCWAGSREAIRSASRSTDPRELPALGFAAGWFACPARRRHHRRHPRHEAAAPHHSLTVSHFTTCDYGWAQRTLTAYLTEPLLASSEVPLYGMATTARCRATMARAAVARATITPALSAILCASARITLATASWRLDTLRSSSWCSEKWRWSMGVPRGEVWRTSQIHRGMTPGAPTRRPGWRRLLGYTYPMEARHRPTAGNCCGRYQLN